MNTIPDLFSVRGRQDCLHIYRVLQENSRSHATPVFVGQPDTESAILESMLLYIQQERIDSEIFCEQGIYSFLEQFAPGYVPRYRSPDLTTILPYKLLKIPHLGSERGTTREVVHPIPSPDESYILWISDRKLVFQQGDNPLGAFTVDQQETDPLLKALFTAEGVRSTPFQLARILEGGYVVLRARQMQTQTEV